MTPSLEKALRAALSYVEAGSQFGGFGPQRRYLIDKKGEFPTGLLKLAKSVLKASGEVWETLDTRVAPKPLTPFKLSLGFKPYREQDEAVEAALKHQRGTIASVTGSGKSVMIAMLIARLNVRALVVVPNLALKRQLTESLREAFGSLKNITVENIDSKSLAKATDYGLLVIDEAHHVAASTYRKLNKKAWTGIFHRFYFTATPFRAQEAENILFESVAGEVIYRLDYAKAVEAKIIAPVEAYSLEVPKKEPKGFTWAAVYKELVVENDARNALILSLLRSLQASGTPTLCLVKEIAHGNTLSQASGIPFANGQSEDCADLIDAFNRQDFPVLIGTGGVLGEGVDSKPCEFVLVAGLGKSRPSLMQQFGRGVRRFPGKESCKVILFNDRSHKFTKSHYAEQVKVLREEYGVEVVKLPSP